MIGNDGYCVRVNHRFARDADPNKSVETKTAHCFPQCAVFAIETLARRP
ncbi:MAG TPA: hypothetical protein VK760_01405 [Candidatus Acidoferrales bacterium]|nr:hypothetical protein [Candidatus Acidoferrales bacterium]